jgi:hypothetical protein
MVGDRRAGVGIGEEKHPWGKMVKSFKADGPKLTKEELCIRKIS